MNRIKEVAITPLAVGGVVFDRAREICQDEDIRFLLTCIIYFVLGLYLGIALF